MTTKREQIEKDYIKECEAAGTACAARLKRAIAKRKKALDELTFARAPGSTVTGAKKKGANPKARP